MTNVLKMNNESLDVRNLMSVRNAEDILAGLSRRERFSRVTTITTFYYNYVHKNTKTATIFDTEHFFLALSMIKYKGVPICNIINDNQVEWNFELTSVVNSIKNPSTPSFRPLPVKAIKRAVKAKRGRPVGSFMRKAKAVRSIRNSISHNRPGLVFFLGLPEDKMQDKDLSRKVQNFLKSLG